MKINLKFFVYCETTTWWWEDYCAVPRVGELVEYQNEEYKVREVKYTTAWVDIVIEKI